MTSLKTLLAFKKNIWVKLGEYYVGDTQLISLKSNCQTWKDLRELSEDKEDEDCEEKLGCSVCHLDDHDGGGDNDHGDDDDDNIGDDDDDDYVHLGSLLAHPHSHCLSSGLVWGDTDYKSKGRPRHLVHSFDKADGEDGESKAGDKFESHTVKRGFF